MSDCNEFEFTSSQGTFYMDGGIRGKDGVTFYPHVSAAGILSWTNDGGKQNPDPVNIKGADGMSAYAAAQQAGFTGTEAQFNAYLSGIGTLTEDVDDLKSAIGYESKVITGAFPNSQGVIEASNVWDCYCYKVMPGSFITKITVGADSQQLLFSFFADEPYVGSAAYNGLRIGMGSGVLTADNVAVPPAATWIAIRVAKTDKPIVNFNLINELDLAFKNNLSDIRTVSGVNLYNWETNYDNIALNTTTGAEYYDRSYNSSDYIQVEPSTSYTVQSFIHTELANHRVYVYDSDKKFIRRYVQQVELAKTGYVITTPSNCAYIRLSFESASNPTAQQNANAYMLVKGRTTIDAYVGYYTSIDYTARQKIGALSSPPPLLTIIDDDGHIDYHDYLLPFCKEVNAPIASAVTTLRMGSTVSSAGRYMTLNEIKECMTNGGEILCHTYSHTSNNADVRKTEVIDGRYVSATEFLDSSGNTVAGASYAVYHDTDSNIYYTYEGSEFTKIPQNAAARYADIIAAYTDVSGYTYNGVPTYPDREAYYVDKLAKNYTIARNTLLNNGCADGNIIVYNNNTGDEELSRSAASRVFRCGFNVHGAQINQYGEFNRYNINRFPIETAAYGYYGVSQLKALIDSCVENGGWMVWTMHTTGNEWRGTTSGSRTGQGRESVLNALREVISYAHSVGLEIVTAEHGYRVYVEGNY